MGLSHIRRYHMGSWLSSECAVLYNGLVDLLLGRAMPCFPTLPCAGLLYTYIATPSHFWSPQTRKALCTR